MFNANLIQVKRGSLFFDRKPFRILPYVLPSFLYHQESLTGSENFLFPFGADKIELENKRTETTNPFNISLE